MMPSNSQAILKVCAQMGWLRKIPSKTTAEVRA
jgi:hypothetical protein